MMLALPNCFCNIVEDLLSRGNGPEGGRKPTDVRWEKVLTAIASAAASTLNQSG